MQIICSVLKSDCSKPLEVSHWSKSRKLDIYNKILVPNHNRRRADLITNDRNKKDEDTDFSEISFYR